MADFNPADYKRLFDRCRRRGLGITVHTGEAGPVEEVAEVIEQLEPSRIGHGVKSAYDPRTMAMIRERGITLEVCPTCNLNTRVVSGWDEFRWIFDTFRRNGVSYTINTDGPEMLKTYIRDELATLGRLSILSLEEQEQSAEWARQASFVEASATCRCRAGRRPAAGTWRGRKPDRMGSLGRAEAARRAGLDEAYLEHLESLGLLKPVDGGYAEGMVRRASLVHALDQAGIPLDGLAEGVVRGEISLDFVETEAYERFAAVSDDTFDEVSARTGVPFELLSVVREAIGLAPPEPTDRVRSDELRVIPFVESQVRLGFRRAGDRALAEGDRGEYSAGHGAGSQLVADRGYPARHRGGCDRRRHRVEISAMRKWESSSVEPISSFWRSTTPAGPMPGRPTSSPS